MIKFGNIVGGILAFMQFDPARINRPERSVWIFCSKIQRRQKKMLQYNERRKANGIKKKRDGNMYRKDPQPTDA